MIQVSCAGWARIINHLTLRGKSYIAWYNSLYHMFSLENDLHLYLNQLVSFRPSPNADVSVPPIHTRGDVLVTHTHALVARCDHEIWCVVFTRMTRSLPGTTRPGHKAARHNTQSALLSQRGRRRLNNLYFTEKKTVSAVYLVLGTFHLVEQETYCHMVW